MDFDLTSVPELLRFFNVHAESQLTSHEKSSASPSAPATRKDSWQLNSSIRKKLFDHNSDDLSTSSTGNSAALANEAANVDLATISPSTAALISVAAGASLTRKSSYRNGDTKKHKAVNERIRSILSNKLSGGELPKPNFASSSSCDSANEISFYDDDHDEQDDGDGSFLFEKKSHLSSPAADKYNRVMCDMGDCGGNTSDDSVFLRSQSPPSFNIKSPNQSAISATPINQSPISENNLMDCCGGSQENRKGGSSRKKPDKRMDSPNLSPIRQASSSSACSSCKNEANDKSAAKEAANKSLDKSFSSNSSISSDGAESVTFTGKNDNHERIRRSKNKREEIYTKSLYHDDNDGAKQENEEAKQVEQQRKEAPPSSHEEEAKTPFFLTNVSFSTRPTLNSINETTTNTSSQDTGYQTNSGGHGVNGSQSNNSSASVGQFSSQPSYVFMDTTNFSSITSAVNNCLVMGAKSDSKRTLTLNLAEDKQLLVSCDNQVLANTITSTPMSCLSENDEFHFNFNNADEKFKSLKAKLVQSAAAAAAKSAFENIPHVNNSNSSKLAKSKFKKSSSASLNSLENIQPVGE
jgi:hypothetical protein